MRGDRRRKRVHSNLVRKLMLELYPFAVPEASVEMISRESYLVNKDDIKRKLRWGMIIRAIQSQQLDASGDTADHSENGDMDKHEEQVLAFLKKIFTLQTEELDDPPSMLYYDYPY